MDNILLVGFLWFFAILVGIFAAGDYVDECLRTRRLKNDLLEKQMRGED